MRPREMRLVCQHTSGNLRGFVVKVGSIHTGERGLSGPQTGQWPRHSHAVCHSPAVVFINSPHLSKLQSSHLENGVTTTTSPSPPGWL